SPWPCIRLVEFNPIEIGVLKLKLQDARPGMGFFEVTGEYIIAPEPVISRELPIVGGAASESETREYAWSRGIGHHHISCFVGADLRIMKDALPQFRHTARDGGKNIRIRVNIPEPGIQGRP